MIEQQNRLLFFQFDEKTLQGKIVQAKNGFCWKMDLTRAKGVACGKPRPMTAEFPWNQSCPALENLSPLQPQDLVECTRQPDGLAMDFKKQGGFFRIKLGIGPAGDEILFELLPLFQGTHDLIAAELPGPLLPQNGEAIQVLCDYRNQGRLYTGKPGPLEKEVPDLKVLRMGEGRHRLRFFGVLNGNSGLSPAKAGYAAIIEENADAQIVLTQEEGGAIRCEPAFLPSMGTLAYSRRVRYCFQESPTVTSLAKRFRDYAKLHGLYKSLKDKIAERPAVSRLVGATAVNVGYLKDDNADYCGTLKQLRELGHSSFYLFPTFHINAGFKRMVGEVIDIRRMKKELNALGALTGSWVYLGGAHEKPEFSRLFMNNPDGSLPLNWCIGDEKWPQVCSQPSHQILNACENMLYDAEAHHFDVTASNALMECHHPQHPLDRRKDRECRIRLFERTTELGRVVMSEGVKDWAVPHYDMGSNKEIPVINESPAYRVLPLTHLVYHDALFFLWWEFDSYDCPYGQGGDPIRQALTDLLYGDMPLLFPVGCTYRWEKVPFGKGILFSQSLALPLCAEAAQRAVRVAAHFRGLALEEMTGFQWLTHDGFVQATQFSNGTSVIANFGSETHHLEGGRTVPPLDVVIVE
ncbi:MAG: hypothetical protein V1913_16570 [Fibrobacterota bacterium]